MGNVSKPEILRKCNTAPGDYTAQAMERLDKQRLLKAKYSSLQKRKEGSFTNRKKTDMHITYGAANGNDKVALRMHQERFLSRRMLNHKMFQRLHRQLSENGSFIAITDGRGRWRTVRQTHQEEEILDHVDDTPGTCKGCVMLSTYYTIIHWCAKIKDEVEKLAYQLNEEAKRTERPVRRLSKVMYGSTCADMQVDVMGECLSSIKHVVVTTSGCFYPRSNHWEVGGRPQCDKCGCKVRNCSQHRFTTLETISNDRNSYPGFSSGRPRGTTPADYRNIVLQARRNRRQTAGEIARHTTQATGRPISRFTVARRLHGGGLFARRPVRCVPLTPAHRRRRSLWCREPQNWRDNEWGRVLFTDESRFSLSSDSHCILIWREQGSRNHPSNIIERDRYGGRGVLVWGGIMLGSRTDLHIFDAGSVNGTRYCNEILLPYVRLFRGAMGLQFLFMDDNAPCHRTVAAEQLLESEDIERMDWPARSPDLNPIEHVWDFLGRRLAARTLPPVTIRELRLALQDEWAAMPQQLIDTLILSMGRRCETCLAVRGDHIPY
ncbi:transposable element Tcb2 transposase [Trichonephila clavipes]|nr:transposable element Tcb2 transposase [Trichonephila clavipes]